MPTESWPLREIVTSLFWHLTTAAAPGKDKGGTRGSDQGIFFILGGMRLLKASMAPSNLWRVFQKSPQRSPFSFKRAKTVFMFNVSGRKLGRNSRGNRGAETGA